MHRSFRKDYEEKYNYQSISSHFNDGSDSCVGSKEKSNAMTIGWGGIGTLWGRTALTVYVAEKRYTKEFITMHQLCRHSRPLWYTAEAKTAFSGHVWVPASDG